MKEDGISTSVIGISIVVIVIVAGVSAYILTLPEEVEEEIITLKIGWLADFTGGLSCYGLPGKYAAEWAVEKINDELYPDGIEIGGKRYNFELAFEDYAYKFEEVPLAIKRLLDQGVFVIMTDLAFAAEPVLPDLESAEVPLFIWLAPGVSDDPSMSSYTFRYRNTAGQTVPAIAYYMVEEFGVEKVAVLNSTDPSGVSIGDDYVTQFEKYGAEVVCREEFDRGTKEFYSYIASVMANDADCIANLSTADALLQYVQARESGFEGYFASYTGLTEVQAEKTLGADYAGYLADTVYQTEGVGAFTHRDAEIREWGFEYFERYGEYPIDLVPWCWDQIMVVVSALEMADNVTDGAEFRSAMAELPYDFLLSDYLKTPMYPQRVNKFFDEDGQALMTVQICGWTEEGCKIPILWAEVDVETLEILSVETPPEELRDVLIEEFYERH